jgi:hypothetical protein
MKKCAYICLKADLHFIAELLDVRVRFGSDNLRLLPMSDVTVFLDVTLYSLVAIYQHFGGTCCAHVQAIEIAGHTTRLHVIPIYMIVIFTCGS